MKNRYTELLTIKKVVDEYFKIDISDKKKTNYYVMARAVYYRLCKKFTKKSLDEIGFEVKKDHATALHALKNFENYKTVNPELMEDYYFLVEIAKIHLKDDSFPEEKEPYKLRRLLRQTKKEIRILNDKLSKSVELGNQQEIKLLNDFRSLDERGKNDVIFKIETAKKVWEKLNRIELI